MASVRHVLGSCPCTSRQYRSVISVLYVDHGRKNVVGGAAWLLLLAGPLHEGYRACGLQYCQGKAKMRRGGVYCVMIM